MWDPLGTAARAAKLEAAREETKEVRKEAEAARKEHKAEAEAARKEHKAEAEAAHKEHKAEAEAARKERTAEVEAAHKEHKAEAEAARKERTAEVEAVRKEVETEAARKKNWTTADKLSAAGAIAAVVCYGVSGYEQYTWRERAVEAVKTKLKKKQKFKHKHEPFARYHPEIIDIVRAWATGPACDSILQLVGLKNVGKSSASEQGLDGLEGVLWVDATEVTDSKTFLLCLIEGCGLDKVRWLVPFFLPGGPVKPLTEGDNTVILKTVLGIFVEAHEELRKERTAAQAHEPTKSLGDVISIMWIDDFGRFGRLDLPAEVTIMGQQILELGKRHWRENLRIAGSASNITELAAVNFGASARDRTTKIEVVDLSKSEAVRYLGEKAPHLTLAEKLSIVARVGSRFKHLNECLKGGTGMTQINDKIAKLDAAASVVVESALRLPVKWKSLPKDDPVLFDRISAFRIAFALSKKGAAPEQGEEQMRHRVAEDKVLAILGGSDKMLTALSVNSSRSSTPKTNNEKPPPKRKPDVEMLLALHPKDNTVAFFSRAIERAALEFVGKEQAQVRLAAKRAQIPFP